MSCSGQAGHVAGIADREDSARMTVRGYKSLSQSESRICADDRIARIYLCNPVIHLIRDSDICSGKTSKYSLELFPNNFLIIFKQISRLPKNYFLYIRMLGLNFFN